MYFLFARIIVCPYYYSGFRGIPRQEDHQCTKKYHRELVDPGFYWELYLRLNFISAYVLGGIVQIPGPAEAWNT
jgi:hypothetical protein